MFNNNNATFVSIIFIVGMKGTTSEIFEKYLLFGIIIISCVSIGRNEM